jgi:hypothetical protein
VHTFGSKTRLFSLENKSDLSVLTKNRTYEAAEYGGRVAANGFACGFRISAAAKQFGFEAAATTAARAAALLLRCMAAPRRAATKQIKKKQNKNGINKVFNYFKCKNKIKNAE